MKKICTIYRSPKKEGMYLYVEKSDDLSRVPDALLKQFGSPQQAMTLLIDADRELSRADAKQVLEDIEGKGFYLQMPPATGAEDYIDESYMTDIHKKNSKMGG